MMKKRSSSLLFFLSFLMIFYVTFTMTSVDARNTNMKKKLHKHHKDNGNGHTRGSHPHPTHVKTFDIMSFGAKGNGVSDDSQSLLAAWKGACKVVSATIKVPAKFKFLIKPIILQGPCLPDLTVQIDGTILAPAEASTWPKSNLFQWINFKWVQNFTIKGSGTIDGQGSNWWSSSELYDMKETEFGFKNSELENKGNAGKLVGN